MKRIISILFCVLLLTGCATQKNEIQGFSMDAPYKITAEGLSKEQVTEIKSYLNRIDSIFNVYREDSVLSQLNQTKILTVSDSEEAMVYDLIQSTLPYCNELFDISIRPVSKLWNFKQDKSTIPNEGDIAEHLTFVGYNNIILTDNSIRLESNAEIEGGAIVKGYVCDQIAKKLVEKNAIIDIGGTVKTVGKSISAGVKSPDGNGLLCSFTLADGQAVATSGSYERSFVSDGKLYHHILNPKTGYPAQSDFVSVTVVCDSALETDILSTTLFMENSLRVPKKAEVICVTKDGLIYVSAGIQNFKLINENYQVSVIKE